MIRALPRDQRAYAAVVLAVAPDRAILEYRYFAGGASAFRALPRDPRGYAAVVLAVAPTARSSSTVISRAMRRRPTA